MPCVPAVQAAQEAFADFQDALADLEQAGLHVSIPYRQIAETLREALSAAMVLDDPDLPMATTYPDGRPAEAPFSVKQVRLLFDLHNKEYIDHNSEVYNSILFRIRQDLGTYGTRQCGGTTKRGTDCRNYALNYAPGPPRCSSHASAEQRKIQRSKKAEEESALHGALSMEGYREQLKKTFEWPLPQ